MKNLKLIPLFIALMFTTTFICAQNSSSHITADALVSAIQFSNKIQLSNNLWATVSQEAAEPELILSVRLNGSWKQQKPNKRTFDLILKNGSPNDELRTIEHHERSVSQKVVPSVNSLAAKYGSASFTTFDLVFKLDHALIELLSTRDFYSLDFKQSKARLMLYCNNAEGVAKLKAKMESLGNMSASLIP